MTAPPPVDGGFAAVLDLVERERGFACAAYKRSCLARRIGMRMRRKGAETYEQYAGVLAQDPRELDRLVAALTVNVTRFFRDPPIWDALARRVIPDLWGRQLDDIRVWSAGCASGEEAYSIAILIHRHAAVHGMLAQLARVSVTGTDVDADVLEAARAASYAEAALADVPEELRRRYLTAEPPYQPSAGIRALVQFARHDLLTDSFPAEPQHLILCRNVLIYFERDVQRSIVERLRAALAPGGYLVLGKVESLMGYAWGFERIGVGERIFRQVS